MLRTCSIVLLSAFSSAGFLLAQAGQTGPTIGPVPPTTIAPYSAPHKPGVPDWVYTSRVSPDLRTRFEVLYQMLNERQVYQQQNTPHNVTENLQKLAGELGDIGSSGARGVPSTVPDWVWHLDDPAQIKWLQERIRVNVSEHHLEDVALSEDLVPSLLPAAPTTIGPAPQGSKQLTPSEVKSLLAPAAAEAAKPAQPAPWTGSGATSSPLVLPGGTVSGASFDPSSLRPEGRTGWEKNQAIIRNETLGVSGSQQSPAVGNEGGINFKRGQTYQLVEGLDKDLKSLAEKAAKDDKPEAKKQ